MSISVKQSESSILNRLQVGQVLLSPLVIRAVSLLANRNDKADARIEVSLPDGGEVFRFVIEAKSRATPEGVQLATMQAKMATMAGEWPMILVPYLSPERLTWIEQAGVSGVDLCGNGLVIVPGRLYVKSTGAPNKHPDSRPLSNPYRGRSSMVGRLLFQKPVWKSHSELVEACSVAGMTLSSPQVSKAIRSLSEDLIVAKRGREIRLIDPLRLLDHLGAEWREPVWKSTQAVRLSDKTNWPHALSAAASLRWAVTGESTVAKHAVFSQGGPLRIAVSDLAEARRVLGGHDEPVPNFGDLELLETEEPGFYFENEIDDSGVRWASRLQTWLELQSGDARQRVAAAEIQKRIILEAAV